MKKWNVVVVLGLVLSLSSYAESTSHNGTTGSGSRPGVETSKLGDQWTVLPESLAKINTGAGLTIKKSTDITGKESDLKVSLESVGKIKAGIESLKKYRTLLATCVDKKDKSAEVFAAFLDEFISKLEKVITTNPVNASGLSEKTLVATKSQAERFILDRASRFFPLGEPEKADKEALTAISDIVTGFHGKVRDGKDEFSAAVKQIADAETLPLVEKITTAIDASALRQSKNEKVCKLTAEAAPEKKEEKTPEAEPKKEAVVEKPRPVEPTKTETPVVTPPVLTPPPVFTPAPVTSVGQGDLDANALLQQFLERLEKSEDDQKRTEDTVTDAIRRLEQANADNARNLQANVDAQRAAVDDNNNAALDALAKGLQNQQQPQQPAQPAPAAPAAPAIVTPEKSAAAPFIPPQQPEQQAPMGGQYPQMPPAAQNSTPPIIFPEDMNNSGYSPAPLNMTPYNPAIDPRIQQQMESLDRFLKGAAYQQQMGMGMSPMGSANMGARLGSMAGAPGTIRSVRGPVPGVPGRLAPRATGSTNAGAAALGGTRGPLN